MKFRSLVLIVFIGLLASTPQAAVKQIGIGDYFLLDSVVLSLWKSSGNTWTQYFADTIYGVHGHDTTITIPSTEDTAYGARYLRFYPSGVTTWPDSPAGTWFQLNNASNVPSQKVPYYQPERSDSITIDFFANGSLSNHKSIASTLFHKDTTYTGLSAGNFYQWSVSSWDTSAIPNVVWMMRDMTGSGGTIPAATSPMIAVWIQYNKNGTPVKGARFVVVNRAVGTDTTTTAIIGPVTPPAAFTDVNGVASVQVPRSYVWNDSTKGGSYNIQLWYAGQLVKQWDQVFLPDSADTHIVVSD